ncbi:MAG TPA: hypothetical protein VK846_17005 [Candidatus Limnocylindria bacterium]|nr:hypothetical protein [Candidatus Limnocylindria bacterium]
MKSGTITGLLSGIILGGFSLGAFAELKDNPYQVIVDRNPFGLKPVPIVEPPKPPDVPAPPPLDIKLTGITTLLGPPRALLEFTDPQTKKTDRPSPFVEGDVYKDSITIVSIDAENNRVRIKNGDAETTLDFDKNGIKPNLAASAPPVAHPGVAPLGLGMPAAGQPTPASGRSAILGGGAAAVAPNPAAAGGLPPRPVRTDTGAAIVGGYQPYQPAAVTAPAQPTMSREDAIARIQAQKAAFQQAGNPAARILPPVPGAPAPGN